MQYNVAHITGMDLKYGGRDKCIYTKEKVK